MAKWQNLINAPASSFSLPEGVNWSEVIMRYSLSQPLMDRNVGMLMVQIGDVKVEWWPEQGVPDHSHPSGMLRREPKNSSVLLQYWSPLFSAGYMAWLGCKLAKWRGVTSSESSWFWIDQRSLSAHCGSCCLWLTNDTNNPITRAKCMG